LLDGRAYGHHGPWRDRRGFDSVVQSVSGLADAVTAPPDAVTAPPVFLPANPSPQPGRPHLAGRLT
jgi:crotonobetainyl-CoA:carnitine CoA-transferase CaiB-like acyl-CoA transferase